MLGTSAQRLEYRTIHDFHSPADYLNYMFDGVQGVMYRATIAPYYYQSYHRASGLIKARYAGVDNCYISMNTFYRTSGLSDQEGRLVSLLKRLNAFYVDIDCYKLGLSKNEVLERLADEYIGSRIPEPTFIIDSGRGIYLVWKLRNEDKRALPRWTAVQQYLTDTLEELGADQACMDAARILRVPFTHNPKSGTDVAIVEFNDLTYSIYDVAKEYEIKVTAKAQRGSAAVGSSVIKYPYGHATEAQRKYVRDIAAALELDEDAYPDFTSFYDTDSWIKLHRDDAAEARKAKRQGYSYTSGNVIDLPGFKSIKSILGSYCAELRKLFAARKGENCKRELALFLYRYWLREMKYDSAAALKETLSFNASMDCPFDEDYVIKVTASADTRVEKGVPYAYKKATIIRLLGITKDELKNLPFLGAGIKSQAERKAAANRKAYENKLAAEGKIAKKDAVLSRRAAILSMQEQGLTPAEIQESLQISRATYHRDVAALNITSILEAARAILADQAKKIKDIAKTAVHTVTEAVEAVSAAVAGAKKSDFAAAVRAALKNAKATVGSLSQNFSHPFIERTPLGVPHKIVLPVTPDKRPDKRRNSCTEDKAPDDPADDDDPG